VNWLKRAFAIEKVEDFVPTPLQAEVTAGMCREVVRRGMTTPALMALEMSKPLNGVAAATMHFFTPLVHLVTDAAGYEAFAAMLEHRGSVAYLCGAIEAAEGERHGNKSTCQQVNIDPSESGMQERQ
jgi:hypothetical protein